MDKELLEKMEARLKALKSEQADVLKQKKAQRNTEALASTRETLNRLKAAVAKTYGKEALTDEELDFVKANV